MTQTHLFLCHLDTFNVITLILAEVLTKRDNSILFACAESLWWFQLRQEEMCGGESFIIDFCSPRPIFLASKRRPLSTAERLEAVPQAKLQPSMM
jgi:hypothetical protein